MPDVIKLHDEHLLLDDLTSDTFQLIGRTKSIDAVKLLTEIYDILNMNASVLREFKESKLTFDEIWMDTPTLKHLNYLRCKLMVFHHTEFISIKELQTYNKSFCRFYNLIVLRLKNGFDCEMSAIS